MPANSLARRALKRALRPLLSDHTYRYIQAASKAWDIRTGSWSEPELELLPFAAAPGDEVLDLGANFGLYCYHLSRVVGATGRIYAFEPVPFTFATLRLVLRLLHINNVTAFDKGVGERNETVVFSVPVTSAGTLSTGQAHFTQRNDEREGKAQHAGFPTTREFPCDVVSLDSFLPKLDRLSLIKCDIEGAEIFAFRGAAALIERSKPTVICEIIPWFLTGFGQTAETLVEFFTSRGYEMFAYTPAKKLMPVALKEVAEDNYVFIHPSRKAQFSTLL